MSPQRVSLLTFPKAAAVSWEASGEADGGRMNEAGVQIMHTNVQEGMSQWCGQGIFEQRMCFRRGTLWK